MRKATRATVAALVMAIVMAFSAGSAFAGWSWEDCPPASIHETQHASDTATTRVTQNSHADNANIHATTANPGQKFVP